MTISMDFNNLTTIDRGHVFLTLEDSIKKSLGGEPEILDRIENSLEFIRKIGGANRNEDRFQCALIRAALTELVSIEDIQRTRDNHRPNTSRHPLLCVVRELRNVQIHVLSAIIDDEKRRLCWGDFANPEEATAVNWTIRWIDNISIGDFEHLWKRKKYTRDDFVQALSWFDDNQRNWGIEEVLFRAISQYGREMANHLATAGKMALTSR